MYKKYSGTSTEKPEEAQKSPKELWLETMRKMPLGIVEGLKDLSGLDIDSTHAWFVVKRQAEAILKSALPGVEKNVCVLVADESKAKNLTGTSAAMFTTPATRTFLSPGKGNLGLSAATTSSSPGSSVAGSPRSILKKRCQVFI